MKTAKMLMLLACCAVFASGCLSQYIAPKGNAKDPIKLSQVPPTDANDFAGVTLIVQDVERQDVIYFLAQSYPRAFVVVEGWRDPQPQGGYIDFGFRVQYGYGKPSQQAKRLLDHCLVFHDGRLVSMKSAPKSLTSTACVRTVWSRMTGEDTMRLKEEVSLSTAGFYGCLASLTKIDFTGLICLPLRESVDYLGLPILEVRAGDDSRVFRPSFKSSAVYRSGLLWALLGAPFTDVGGNFEVGAFIYDSNHRLVPDGHASVLNQMLVWLNESPLKKGYAARQKEQLFEALFARKGYTVHRYQPTDKAVCLISEPGSPVRLFWEGGVHGDSYGKTPLEAFLGWQFLEQLKPSGDELIDWTKQAPEAGRNP